jgi:hypothetical protein
MSVGYPALAPDVNARIGQLVVTLRDTFAKVQIFKAWIDAQPDVYFTTTLGYSAGDVTLLRATITDLDNLRKVATAQQSTAVNDFFFNAKNVVGVI